MPVAPKCRASTGNRRRGAKKNKTRHHRQFNLGITQLGFMHNLQMLCFAEGSSAIIALSMIPQLLFMYSYALNDIGDDALATFAVTLLHMNVASYALAVSNFNLCMRFDTILHDITPEELAAMVTIPSQNVRFNSWDDRTCYSRTNFTKDQLRRIYSCFGLAQVANATGGYVRVPIGHNNQRGVACCYRFHPEELFLYLMMRMKTGDDHTQMNEVFGGDIRRWSFAWRWIMLYLDERYKNIIGHQGLLHFVDEFPAFYDAINQKVQRSWVSNYNRRAGTYQVTDGLAFLPFDLFGFIDCSIDKISRPLSGPDGDFEGCGRKEYEEIVQRAFYTGYKKIHGIKVETVLLPNGISPVFGPVSARRFDITGVLQMSRLNEFLVAIQQNRQHEYQHTAETCVVFALTLEVVLGFLLLLLNKMPATKQLDAAAKLLSLATAR